MIEEKEIKIANIREMYEMAAASVNDEAYIATVIAGDNFGEKAFIAGGCVRAVSIGGGFFEAYGASACSIRQMGIFSVRGREIYMELLGDEPDIVICGAGHVSMPIISIAKMMNLHVTVIDDRRKFADNAEARGADRVICNPFDEAMAEIDGSDDTYFVVVTRGHNYDKDCVGGALLKPHAYVGMIGSKRHAEIVRELLLNEGIAGELVESVYTPIGLDIGAETPEEIAVAIVAEIIEVKNRRRRNVGIPKEIMKAIASEWREPMVLTTIVSKSGSGPRTVGAKMLVRKDGSIIGTIGGGLAENEVIGHARKLLEEGFTGTEMIRTNMNARLEDEGMVCGGSAEVLFELI